MDCALFIGRGRNLKRNVLMIMIAAVIVVIAVGALGLIFYKDYKEKHAPSTTVMPLGEYYGISGEEAMVIIDEKVYDKNTDEIQKSTNAQI